MPQLSPPGSVLPALGSRSPGQPTRAGSKVRLEPIDAAVRPPYAKQDSVVNQVGSQNDSATGRIRPKALTRTRSLPHSAILAVERMRRFSKESAAAEEQQCRRSSKEALGDLPQRRASMGTTGDNRRTSKEGPGDIRRGSKEGGALRRASTLRAPIALGKTGREDDGFASYRSSSTEPNHTAAEAAAAAAAAAAAKETREKQELARFSRELGMPMDVIKEAADLFRSHLDNCVIDSLVEATLPLSTLGDLFGQKVEEKDETRPVNFKSFAMAFFCRGFSEGCVLTPEQRELRKLARKHDMEFANMDYYKRCFDEFDSDQNKFIDATEFKALLYRLNKMPEGYSLPESRVQQLWAEADQDKNGVLDFEEFVSFYRKYYDRKNGEKCPFSRFYCTSRHTQM